MVWNGSLNKQYVPGILIDYTPHDNTYITLIGAFTTIYVSMHLIYYTH